MQTYLVIVQCRIKDYSVVYFNCNDSKCRIAKLPLRVMLVRIPEVHEYLIHLFIISLTCVKVWESMGKPCSYMQFIKSRFFFFYCKSRENLYQVLQVMCAASERAMKSKVRLIKS